MAKNHPQEIPLDKIRIDGDTQPRASLNEEAVADYAAAPDDLPPGKATFDGSAYWLYGGFHRYFARKKAGKTTMMLEVVEGTVEEARWLALAENIKHGLRRTNEDKRRAVERALRQKPELSDGVIAEHVGVSPPTVATVRSQLENFSSRPERVGRDGRTRDTSNIGKNQTQNGNTDTSLWCDRCKRIGTQGRDCPGCKLRRQDNGEKKQPKEKAPPEPKEEPTDPHGVIVPKRCRDAFADPWIDTAINTLVAVAETLRDARLADGMNKRKKHYPFFIPQDFIDGIGMVDNTLDKLVEHLQSRRPAAVCPNCTGKGCSDCSMSGLVHEELYEKLTGGVK